MENNKIAIVSKDLIEKLPIGSQKYIIAKQTIKITELKTGNAIKGIYDIIAQSMINSGNKKDLEDIELITNIAESVYQLISTKHPYLTVDEFKLICFNGVSLEYGEFYGINLTTISNWIKSFNNDIKRKQAMHYWDNLIHLATIVEKTPQQKRQIIIDGLMSLHNHLKPNYEQNKDKFKFDMPIISHIFYDLLKELGLINFSSERKQEIYNRAKNKYEMDLIKAKNDPSIKFKQSDLESALLNLPKDRTFANVCKLEALRDYMYDILDLDEDLNSLIADKI
jgi:hypothetical protein